MRRLAWLFVLPLALCQYQQQQQQQRYQQQGYPNQYNPQQPNLNAPQNPQQYNQQQNQQRNQQQGSRYQQGNFQQGYQQGQYGQNGQMGQNQGQIGRSEVSHTPTRLIGGNLDANSLPGAQIMIQLQSYSNSDLSISNTTTCSCPNGKYCDYLSPTGQNDCMFSFMTVISAKEQSVQFVQSDFYPFQGAISQGNWTMPMSYQMPSKPVAIDVFVQHLGVVIHKINGNLMFFNHLTLVDSFVVDVTTYIPSQNQNPRTFQLTGTQLKTSLSLTISVNCINGYMGTDCDLQCDNTVNTDNVICTDIYGRNTSCKWNNYKTQVTDCIVCNTVGANGTCSQVIMERHDGVSHAFRTWTIVLGCLLGVALLFILCLIISFIILRNRADRDETTSTAYKQEPYTNGKSAVSRPLLDDEWATNTRRPIMPERTDDRVYNRDLNSSISQRQEHQV